MKAFREYSDKFPFRYRSETPEIATELSLQCWRRFGMDGVIMFSDILTPLPALGIDFDFIKGKGPVIHGDLANTLAARLAHGPDAIREVITSDDFLKTHGFLRETLKSLRAETEGQCTLIGFIGAPWTLAAYSIEGGSSKDAANMQRLMFCEPHLVDEFLRRITVSITNYAIFQIHSGAQCIQIFDSWAHQLTPELWRRFAAPAVRAVAEGVRKACPTIPLLYFANGGSPYFRDQVDELAGCIDVLSLDQRSRLREAAKMLEGSGIRLQGNADPCVLRYGSEREVRDAVRRAICDAGGPGAHIMNLGHGVLQGTPEENVLFFCDEAQSFRG